jgi:PAS domain S-box-containing protein
VGLLGRSLEGHQVFLELDDIPNQTELESIHRTLTKPGEIEKRIEQALKQDDEQNALLEKIGNSVVNIERELRFNGGSTIRDTVEKLKKRDEEKWMILMGLHDFAKELSLRMDITDESDNRMSFKLGTNKACIYVSENFLRFFRYSPNDILGSDWEFCIHPKYRPGARSGWKRAFENKTVYRNEQIIVASDGTEHLCLVKAFPLASKDGEFRGFYGIVEVLESLDDE